MLIPSHKNSFKKDVKLMKKRGKDIKKLYSIISDLIRQKPLSKKTMDHPLIGEYSDCRECHIEPDWLLIYLIKNKMITFIRTGTHADLFR
ncbi:MAG: damage inducible protein [Gammaproteobacteria bacterium]|jgi:mRNA interferase YafQ|nr:damage inducible protein [Gammaproteobacteria bacterium]